MSHLCPAAFPALLLDSSSLPRVLSLQGSCGGCFPEVGWVANRLEGVHLSRDPDPAPGSLRHFLFFFLLKKKILFIYFQREGKGGRKRERNINV